MDERCPACGDTDDFCVGHDAYSPAGRVLLNHHKGRHRACSPTGCDEAFEAAIARMIEAEEEGVNLTWAL